MSNAVTMYNFHVWANQTMINRLKELPRDVYTQQIQSIFPTISKLLAHMYFVDLSWFHTISGISMSEAMERALQSQEQVESSSLEELEAMYAELSVRFKALLDGQDDLEKTIVLDNPYAGVRNTRLSEMVLQVVNHATYHRGNISAMLRQMGHASVMTEYALFWYQDEAKAAETAPASV
ncbi:DinB family protein [Paenibacillus allorhizosphaerae]|uniref:Damage-inducible protein DinB n=1 Tax=Paenibacillus allorhizosphaerae TaxID=2849866 RepID=A0ABM8VFT9_9BACL|nr:DinB family protein [Paenibacillus allorhizosphaerae]CAG7636087.1 hypothetical protein PAECIP111802_02215 [Paenibacillus allorhizosphaerae]